MEIHFHVITYACHRSVVVFAVRLLDAVGSLDIAKLLKIRRILDGFTHCCAHTASWDMHQRFLPVWSCEYERILVWFFVCFYVESACDLVAFLILFWSHLDATFCLCFLWVFHRFSVLQRLGCVSTVAFTSFCLCFH